MSYIINKNQALGYLEWDDFRGHLAAHTRVQGAKITLNVKTHT